MQIIIDFVEGNLKQTAVLRIRFNMALYFPVNCIGDIKQIAVPTPHCYAYIAILQDENRRNK